MENSTSAERGRGASEKSNLKKSPQSRLNLSGDDWLMIEDIPGFYYHGIQYFDFKKVNFINYNGLANLVKFMKEFLEKGIEIQFVNVSETIKKKIKEIGLGHVLNCK